MNTTIKSISAFANGTLEIELTKRPLDPYNEAEIVHGCHRLAIEAGSSVEILDEINTALSELGVASVADNDWQRVRNIASSQ